MDCGKLSDTLPVMKPIHTGLIAFILAPAAIALAQLDSGNPLNGLDTLKDFQAMRVSSADPHWQTGNHDSRPIPPGQTLVLADLKGPGRIVHFWNTVADQEPYYSRLLTLRIYWDGETNPSVECPLGDFFGVGLGVDEPFASLPVRIAANGRGRNCYWPMPFRKSARITVSNDGSHRCNAFYYQIDWQKLPSLPRKTPYFCAGYRQEYPCVMGRNYTIADIKGRGQYVGTVLSVYATSSGWFGEGNDHFFIDGEKEPSLRGTGLEDYFCSGWGFSQERSQREGPYCGAPLWEENGADNRGSFYRWHIPDPVTFKKSLHVEIEHKGAQQFPDGKGTGFIERDDCFSSAAFWYQIEPHLPFPPLPAGPARFPYHDDVLFNGLEAVTNAQHSAAPAEVQVNFTATGKRVSFAWFALTNGNGWVELSFTNQETEDADLMLDTVHAPDYGNYRVLLDGQKIAQLGLFAFTMTPATDKLGWHHLAAGKHTLRFEGAGKSPASHGFFLAFDTLVARVPVYHRSPNVDLRTLQKPVTN
jgi:hypothetical protein